MKFRKPFFYIAFFITFFVSSQTKNDSVDKTISINDSIIIKLKKALQLTYIFEYNKALILTQQCLKQADSIKNDSLLGKSYLTYGIISTYLGKEKQAIQNQKKAEAIFLKTKNYKYLGSAYNNIGWSYAISNKNSDSIIIYYKKALDAYTKANDNRRTATALNNIGYKYIELNELDKAELMLKRSLNLTKKNPKINTRNYSLSYTYISFCLLYKKKKNLQKALEYANIAEKIALENKYENQLSEVYKQKSEIFGTQGNYIKAHLYLKKYHKELKQVHQKEKSKVTQEMAAKFEVKEHKRVIEKIKLENNIKVSKLKKSKQLISLIISLLIITFFTAFLLFRNNKLKVENNTLLTLKHQQLKELQLKTELIFLKTQIQPHFFFNTLNNLYSLIIDKSDKAKDVVIKLSELMQYTLSNTKKIKVPIKEEINNIENYLNLEGLRHDKIASSNIIIEGKMDNVKVPPLLYISFIENCFKHNNVTDENFKLFISFRSTDSKYLFFKVKNTLTSPIKNKRTNKLGIGIKNVRRRLKLIYKDEYDLKISTDNSVYSVNLKIPLS